jgi:hypothetical protein
MPKCDQAGPAVINAKKTIRTANLHNFIFNPPYKWVDILGFRLMEYCQIWIIYTGFCRQVWHTCVDPRSFLKQQGSPNPRQVKPLHGPQIKKATTAFPIF